MNTHVCRFMGACFLLLVLLGLAGGEVAVSAEPVVRLALRWDHQFQFAGYYAALWNGYYAEEGLSVEFFSALDAEGNYHSSIERVVAGQAEFGIGGADILMARERGEKLVVLACLFQQSGVRFFYTPERPVRSLADLTRMRVVRRLGDLIDIEFQALLAAEGIDPGRVRPLKHDLSQGYFHDLAEGTVDVVPGYNIGSPYEADRIGLEVRSIRPGYYGVDFYGDSLFTREAFARNHPDVVKRFRRASLRGWEYALQHPQEIKQRILVEYTPAFPLPDFAGFLDFQVQPVTELTLYPVVELGHINPDRWRKMHALLQKAGLVHKPFDEKLVWMPDERTWAERYGRTLAYAVGAAVMGVGVVLGWNWLLRRRVIRKTAELDQARQRYQTLVENQTDLVVEYNNRFELTFVSPSYCKLFGRKAPDLLGGSVLDPVDAADRPAVQKSLQELRSEPYTALHEERVQTPAGQRWLSWHDRAVLDDTGQPQTFVGMGRDITERIRFEEALRESELRFRAIANYTSDWENWIGPDGALLWVNQAVEKHTGYTPAECLAMPCFPFPIIHPDSRDVVAAHMARTGRQDSGNDEELRILRKDGTARWMSVSWQPIYDEQGQWLGHRSSLRDITRRKELENKLLQTQKLESLGVLAGGVAHDFNNLLLVILGNLELALTDLNDPALLKELLQEAQLSGKRAADLAGKMLAFSGHGHFKLRPLSLNTVVEDVYRLIHSSLPRKTDFRLELDPGLPTVLGDETQLRQVLMNLILNAAESCPAAGCAVLVRTGGRCEELGRETTTVLEPPQTDGPTCRLQVLDRGCGMDDETRKRIFEPFFTTKFTGRGLGLASVLGIMRGHKGGMNIHTEPGKGTLMELTLPVSTVSSDPAATNRSNASTAGASQPSEDPDAPFALLVDDEESVLNVATRMLQKLRLHVRTASAAAPAMAIIEDRMQQIDLLIVDMHMPDGDGLEVCRHCRQHRPGVPILLCSGFSGHAPQLADAHEIVDAFLQKPFTQDSLRNRVHALLNPQTPPH